MSDGRLPPGNGSSVGPDEHLPEAELLMTADRLWGHQTDLALANFAVSGHPVPIQVVHALAAIKAEAAIVNVAARSDVSAENQRRYDSIVAAANAIERGDHDDQFLIDIFQTGSGTSTNMNVNEVVGTLAARAGGLAVHPNDDVNESQSSNDAFPTAVTVAAVVGLTHELLPALARLRSSLAAAATRFADVVKAGRTHLMDAVPIFLGDEFDGYAAQIDEAIERIESAMPRIGRVPLGGTAVGTGLNAPPTFGADVVARIAARYGIELSVAPNRFAAQAARDGIVEASSHLRTLAVALLKIANDIRWMGSGPATGLGELQIPELQAGSSIMPGKVNPVMCETVAQVCAQVFGNDTVVAFAGSQGSFELNTYQPVIAANIVSSITLLSRASTLFAEKCIDGLVADIDRCRLYAESTPALATGLNETLGYDNVAGIVKTAVAQRRSLIDVVREDGRINPEQASDLLDPVAVARGNREPSD
jgi:fumarate hydratase, class II